MGQMRYTSEISPTPEEELYQSSVRPKTGPQVVNVLSARIRQDECHADQQTADSPDNKPARRLEEREPSIPLTVVTHFPTPRSAMSGGIPIDPIDPIG
jgi:hypothetical protein